VETQACALIIPLALVFLLILFVLSLELCVVELRVLFATMWCMRLCYMFYMCHVDHFVLFTYVSPSSWFIGEMAMELLSGFSSLSFSEFHID
jgi:hypothetical protein